MWLVESCCSSLRLAMNTSDPIIQQRLHSKRRAFNVTPLYAIHAVVLLLLLLLWLSALLYSAAQLPNALSLLMLLLTSPKLNTRTRGSQRKAQELPKIVCCHRHIICQLPTFQKYCSATDRSRCTVERCTR